MVDFLLYDTPKGLLLLTGFVLAMGMFQTFSVPERARSLLTGREATPLLPP